MDIKEIVKKEENYIINIRRQLHKVPELGNELPKTVAIVKKELDKLGIEYKELMNGNAIVALIKGKENGKTIALRADMDALPIVEDTNLEFASKNGCMHACGHDSHTAMVLGAAKVLDSLKENFSGNVKLLFQPGEEYPGGALPMIEEGALENPKVDAILGCHAGHINNEVPYGNVGVSFGETMASMDRVLIKVNGKGVHGAYPEQGIDPIIISCEIVTTIQTIISREIKPTDNGLISICRINGGFNQNIIPDFVELEGTVRATDPSVREKLAKRIEEIAKGVAKVHGGDCDVDYIWKYPPVINDKEFTKGFVSSIEKIMGNNNITALDKPVMGGEDMAYFLEKVKGTFFFLSNAKEVEGKIYPHHNPKFDVDESLFYLGTAVFVQGVLDFLSN